MTAENGILLMLLGLLFGAVVVGLIVFFYMLLSAVKRLSDAVVKFNAALAPLVGNDALANAAASVVRIESRVPQVIEGLEAVGKSVALFSKFIFGKDKKTEEEEEPGNEFAPPGTSGFVAHSEEEAAHKEIVQTLRKSGIETEESRIARPTAEQVYRDEA